MEVFSSAPLELTKRSSSLFAIVLEIPDVFVKLISPCIVNALWDPNHLENRAAS